MSNKLSRIPSPYQFRGGTSLNVYDKRLAAEHRYTPLSRIFAISNVQSPCAVPPKVKYRSRANRAATYATL